MSRATCTVGGRCTKPWQAGATGTDWSGPGGPDLATAKLLCSGLMAIA
jgi:hypothetical protein